MLFALSLLALAPAAFTNDDNIEQSSTSLYAPSTSKPNGKNESQEFLVVNLNAAPEIDPTSATGTRNHQGIRAGPRKRPCSFLRRNA